MEFQQKWNTVYEAIISSPVQEAYHVVEKHHRQNMPVNLPKNLLLSCRITVDRAILGLFNHPLFAGFILVRAFEHHVRLARFGFFKV